MDTINNDLCIICLELLDNDLTSPENCNCKIILHNKCLEDVKKNGLLCPICRNKNEINNREINTIYIWFNPQPQVHMHINSGFMFMYYIWPFNVVIHFFIMFVLLFVMYIFYYYVQLRIYIFAIILYLYDFFT